MTVIWNNDNTIIINVVSIRREDVFHEWKHILDISENETLSLCKGDAPLLSLRRDFLEDLPAFVLSLVAVC